MITIKDSKIMGCWTCVENILGQRNQRQTRPNKRNNNVYLSEPPNGPLLELEESQGDGQTTLLKHNLAESSEKLPARPPKPRAQVLGFGGT